VVMPGVRVGATVARPLGSKIPERVEGYATLRNDEASFVRVIRAAAIGMCCRPKRKEKGNRKGRLSEWGRQVLGGFPFVSEWEFFY